MIHSSNKILMNHKREYSLRTGREKHLQQLITEFNQQLKISSTTQRSFSPHSTSNEHLPIIPRERVRPRSDRLLSQRLKYQQNLHTVIFGIKQKIQATQRLILKESSTRSRPSSPLRISSNDFRIKAMNLSPEKSKVSLSKSYVESTQKKLAQERRKKRVRYQRFDFEPWGVLNDYDALQTIEL